jgi:hypothetical protein
MEGNFRQGLNGKYFSYFYPMKKPLKEPRKTGFKVSSDQRHEPQGKPWSQVPLQGAGNLPGAIKGNKVPWFRNPLWWLVIITCLLYCRTLHLGFTRLDDSIFIVENEQYNKGFDNLGTSFQRGLFHPTEDVYYRPLFLVDFIIESKIFGTKPAGYHFTNLLFHLLSVVLLYTFLRRLKLSSLNAFLLAMIFAVHPVLSQAVAWIPGRNDMLLMIFFLSGMIITIDYMKNPGPGLYIIQACLFLLALFTKETAVIIPLIMAGVLLFCFRVPWKKILPVVAGWVVAVLIWFLVRASATLSHRDDLFSDMMHSAWGRLPAIIQYLGKIFFPVNLTVFPVIDGITLVWGTIATVLFIALIVVSKSYKNPLTWIGLFWFLAFLLPVLIVPKSLNDQVFEHRLYIPLVGILLMLGPTLPLSDRWPENRRLTVFGLIGIIFAVTSFIRTGYYSDPLTFWTKAVEGSPRSCYARMMLGTKVDSPAKRERLFLEAWVLDSTQKNLNYYLGKVMADKKAFDSSAFFLRKEIGRTQNPDVFFMLAQLAYMKQHYDTTAAYLEKVIEMDPLHPQANPNLVLVYLQMNQKEKAKMLLEGMRRKGMPIPADLETMVAKTK